MSLTIAALLGTGSGIGSTSFYLRSSNVQEIVRPDPATGTELRAIKRELDYHLHNHPDVINQFDRRLTRLETRIELLQQQRISP